MALRPEGRLCVPSEDGFEMWCTLAIFHRFNGVVTVVLKDRAMPENTAEL